MKESAYAWKVVATGPGHGIALDNGRLLVPVWMANGADDRSHNNTAVTTLYSDDSGANWAVGELVSYNEMPLPESGATLSNPNETQLVQLSDGSVMINSKAGYFAAGDPAVKRGRAVSVSPDGVHAWTTPVFDPVLVDSGCFASLARYPGANKETSEDGILFVNPNSAVSRENLTLRLSTDNGKTWPHSKLIQFGGSAYADIAVGPDKTIYILYEKGPYNHLTLARFTLDWLLRAPPETQLMNIELAEGVLSPQFISENNTYSAAVAENTQNIHITAHAFINANSRITVDGTAVSSGETVTLEMKEDTKTVVIAVSSQNQSETQHYFIHLAKQKRVAAFQFEIQPDGGLFDSASRQVKDAVFNGNVSYTKGLTGNGLLFQTTGDAPEQFGLVDMADIDALRFGTGDFSVSFWIHPESVTGQKLLFWYSNNTSETSQWWLRIQDGKIAFSTGYKGPGEPKASETNADSGNHKIQPNVWSHIVAQRKEGVMSIYINGEKCAEKGNTPWNVSSGESCTLYIGRAKGKNIRPFEGILDELQFFNYGFTQEEILRQAEPPAVSYVMTVKAAEGGQVSGSGHYTVGEEVIVTAYPEDNYQLEGWYTNGVLRACDTAYRFEMPAENQILTARFLLNGHVVPVESVSIQSPTLTVISRGKSLVVAAAVLPENATVSAVRWKSSNEQILLVDEGGKITALQPGMAVLTAASADGQHMHSIVVRVTP